MERLGLDGLERLVLHSALLQRFVLRAHTRALQLLATLSPVARVTVVGGGLFPRSCLILSTLLPSARITIIDADAANLSRARAFVDPARVDLVHAKFPGGDHSGQDLVVIPLSFDGDRASLYAQLQLRCR